MKTPSLTRFVAAVGRVGVAAVQRKPIFVSDEEKQMRVEICHVCEHYLEDSDQCSRCTCFVAVKAALATEKCPDNNWPDASP